MTSEMKSSSDDLSFGSCSSDYVPYEKQLTVLSSSPSLSSALEKVVSNEDILTEILLGFPVRSLLQFKSVSKGWYHLITNPNFTSLLNPNPKPPSGIFLPAENRGIYEFLPFDVQNPVKPPFRALNFVVSDVGGINIEQSSNGLMLCRSICYVPFGKSGQFLARKYHVYNPTINKFATLPHNLYTIDGSCEMTLAFDPSKSSHYMVVGIRPLDWDSVTKETNCKVLIYSSETRTWKDLCHFGKTRYPSNFKAGVYWNEAVHWYAGKDTDDEHKGLVFYFKLDDKEFRQIEAPAETRFTSSNETYLVESCGRLFLIDNFRDTCRIPDCDHNCYTIPQVNIYEMRSDYSGWSLMYNVDLTAIFTRKELSYSLFDILSLFLGDEREEQSFLVVVKRSSGEAIRFQIVSKTFTKLHHFLTFSKRVRSAGLLNAFQFKESLCEVGPSVDEALVFAVTENEDERRK